MTGKRKKGNDAVPLLVMLGGIILIGIAVWVTVSPSNTPTPTAVSLPATSPPIPYPEVERVSIMDAKAGFENGSVEIVDVRSDREYRAGHIPGALSMPLTEFSSSYQELPLDRLIYLYCT